MRIVNDCYCCPSRERAGAPIMLNDTKHFTKQSVHQMLIHALFADIAAIIKQ